MQERKNKTPHHYSMTSPQPPLMDNNLPVDKLRAEKELLCLNVPVRNAIASNGRSLSVLRPPSPSVNTLQLTDALSCQCNLNCVYCPLRKAARETPPMTPEERVAIWQDVYHAFRVQTLSLTLFGGEPFLDVPYIRNLLTLAAEKKLPLGSIEIVTNGTIVTPEVIDLINTHRIRSLHITLDGPANIHNTRRLTKNGEDGYSLILRNMETLLSETSVQIVINTVLDRKNIRHYQQMVNELISRFSPFVTGRPPRITFRAGGGCLPYMQTE